MAEYEACIMGHEEAMDLRIKILDVYGNFTLVINQIKGEWDTRHPGLIPYKEYARSLLPFFNKVEFHHIPRDEFQMADALAILASMYQINGWNKVPRLQCNFLIDQLICLLQRGRPMKNPCILISSIFSRLMNTRLMRQTKIERH